MSLQQVLDKFSLLGRAMQREPEAVSEKQALQARVDIIAERSAAIAGKDKPHVVTDRSVFNADHWAPELVAMAGGIACLGSHKQLSMPKLTLSAPLRTTLSLPSIMDIEAHLRIN